MAKGMDHEMMSSEIDFFDPLTEEQCRKAQLLCCANAINTGDAEILMRMLGVFPGEEDFDPSAQILSIPINTSSPSPGKLAM